ncbi:MAG: hypothetical protein J5614_02080 [Paludibacteraceae bacterium]|nr:hypothetical protein [Paludibacteraceae bacterium]
MIIRVNSDNDIIQFITIGGDKDAPDCYEVDDIPFDIMEDIFSYRYIDGQFVRKPDTDSKHVIEAKKHKIQFLNDTCASLIEGGIQIGDDHYSLSYADQINLSKLVSQVTMYPEIPVFYHADGQLCRQYTPEEITSIGQVAEAWVIYHTTYCNYAKGYINSLHDFNAVRNLKYGDRLSDEFQIPLDAILATTQIIFRDVIVDPFDYDTILYPNRDYAVSALDNESLT